MIESLISEFTNAKLVSFLRSQNSSFVDYEEDLSDIVSDFEKFDHLIKLGEIEYQNTDKLMVFTCEYQGELTSRSSRKGQYEIAKKALKEDFKDGAVFVFYDQVGRFRFSFLRRNYGDKTNKFTPWKRYTYFVEPDAKSNRTFIDRVGACRFDSLDAIQSAFSVEQLTKDFYKELSNWYFWAIKNVSFPNDIADDTDDEKYNSENVIRLITRLIFVWFLKQKGLVRNELFDTEALTEILSDFDANCDQQTNYYRAILQNLFFATLNQEIDKRGFAEDKGFVLNRENNGIKNLYRYETEFKQGTAHIMELFSEVPFLNGGLFECLDRKVKDGKNYDWDGFSRNPKFQAKIPNCLFFANEKKEDLSKEYNDTKMKSVKVTGIIEILNRYNFTIEENTPVEIEVALDPELLGKVFENLLGAFNPETQETARKQTGSFYTPREIVNYMVDESLIAYFKTKVTDIDEDTLRMLFSYDDQQVEIADTHKEALIQAAFDCKILDPACGSGAFPMGILQQMVHILRKLDPDRTHWNKVVMTQAMKDFEKADKQNDEDIEKLREEIEKTFDDGLNYPDYARKLHVIENCIYGVDIQSIAVQISKLRFFISLVCEQRRGTNAADNFGIRPLPNLETKFVAANTLIGLEKTEEDLELFNDDHIKTLIDKLQHLRHRQFSVTNANEKKRLREKDEEIRHDIENEVTKLYVKHADDQLGKYKLELKLAEKELEVLNKKPDDIRTNVQTDLFGTETQTSYNFTEAQRKDLKGRIKLLTAKIERGSDYSRLSSIVTLARQLTSWNPYDQNASSPFFDPEWMFGLPKQNEGYFDVVIGNPPYGIVKSTNTESDVLFHYQKYFSADFKINLFALFLEQSINLNISQGINSFIIPDSSLNLPAFKRLRSYILESCALNFIAHYNEDVFESAAVGKSVILSYSKGKFGNTFLFRSYNDLNNFEDNVIEINKVKKDDDLKFVYKTNDNDIDILLDKLKSIPTKLNNYCDIYDGINPGSEEIKNTLITDSWIDNHSKKIIDGKSFNKFTQIDWQGDYIYYNPEYVEKLRRQIESKGIPFTARIIKKSNFFEFPKIVTRQTADTIIGTLDSLNYYAKNSVHSTLLRKECESITSLKFILSILNSKVIEWFYRTESLESGRLFPQVKIERLRQLPIIIANKQTQIKIENLIKDLLDHNKSDKINYNSTLIDEIDIIVYKLYCLQYSEVKLIDPEIGSKISEADYNAIEV